MGLLFGGHLVAQSADAFNLYLYDVAGMHVQGGSFRAGPNNVSRLEGVVTGYFLDVQLPKVGRLRERWEVMNASTSDSSYAPARSSRLRKKGVSVKLTCRWSQKHNDIRP